MSQLKKLKNFEEPKSPGMQVIIKRNSPHLRIEDNDSSHGLGMKVVSAEPSHESQGNLFELESRQACSIIKDTSRPLTQLEDVD